jgi:adenosylmethionine-8-amino-7-oxononanoate aminotransferase
MEVSQSEHSRLEDLDRRHVIHPITEFRTHEEKGPRLILGGKGVRLETSGGKSVIDGFSGLFNINVGHGRTEIADAVHAQMQRMAYYPAFWDFSTEPAILLAERLAGLFPADRNISRFIFTTGGSDANETNFRLARFYHASNGQHERCKVLSRRSSYHGVTRAAGSATSIPAYHVFADVSPVHHYTAAPYCLRCEYGKTRSDCSLECAEDVEAVIQREGPETVSAVIAEPIQGTGGIITPPAGYFDRLQEICSAHGVLLILDEVITGFGRTGKWFGMEHYDIKPDLVSFAKGISSGYLPLGGCGLSDRVYETIRDGAPKGLPFMGGLTYNNHPSCCAAALANLDIIEKEGLVENAREMGDYMLASVRNSLGDHPFVKEIRGIGLLASIEFGKPDSLDPVADRPMAFTAAVSHHAWDRGLIARAMWETVSLAPPLCINRAEVDELVDIVTESANDAKAAFPEG